MNQITCIAAPRLDGHTRAIFRVPEWSNQAREVFNQIRTLFMLPNVLEAHRKNGPVTARICGQITAEVSAKGARATTMQFYVVNRVRLIADIKQRTLQVQWKAKELWHNGAKESVEFWIKECARFFANEDHTLANAHELGWRMTGIEVCADFQNLSFARGDIPNFVGWHKRGEISGDYTASGDPETISLGRRSTSNVSLQVYDKSAQIKAKGESNKDTYEPVWQASGYDEKTKVTRVEIRLKSRGLELRADGEALNLRDPNVATDPQAIARLWASMAHKLRLVVPGTATRKTRRETDSRWVAVIAAAEKEPEHICQARAVKASFDALLYRRKRELATALYRVLALSGLVFTGENAKRVLFQATEEAQIDPEVYIERYRDLHAYYDEWIGIKEAQINELKNRLNQIFGPNAARIKSVSKGATQ